MIQVRDSERWYTNYRDIGMFRVVSSPRFISGVVHTKYRWYSKYRCYILLSCACTGGNIGQAWVTYPVLFGTPSNRSHPRRFPLNANRVCLMCTSWHHSWQVTLRPGEGTPVPKIWRKILMLPNISTESDR